MGVGVQREGGIGVAQDSGEGLSIYTAGQSMGGEGVPQIMEPDVGQSRLF